MMCEKEWTSHGFGCEVRMHPTLHHRCGYVALPETHPLHGHDFSYMFGETRDLDVHGGVTFAHKCEDGKYRIGFDCAHCDDAPDMTDVPEDDYMWRFLELDGHVWTLEEVVAETERLAEQLAKVGDES